MLSLDEAQQFDVSAELWLWNAAKASWHFFTLPQDVSEQIKFLSAGMVKGFGSVRVEVKLANSAWKTSLFPSKNIAAYILPVKASIRKAESLELGKTYSFRIRVL